MAAVDWPLIRRPQLRALGLAAREAFAERLARHVAEVFPTHAAFVQRDAGRRFLNRCIDAALRLGLKDQHSVALYTDLAVALGEGFESDERLRWLRALLHDRQLSGPARLCLVYDQLPERCPGPPLLPPDEADDQGDKLAAAGWPAPAVPLWPPGHWG
jgi:hypothetical protein